MVFNYKYCNNNYLVTFPIWFPNVSKKYFTCSECDTPCGSLALLPCASIITLIPLAISAYLLPQFFGLPVTYTLDLKLENLTYIFDSPGFAGSIRPKI